MDARRHGWLVGGVAALALGAFAPAASAATANITDDGTEQVLHYDAAPGEANNMSIEGGPDYTLTEVAPAGGTPVPIVSGNGCAKDPAVPSGVSCFIAGLDRIEVNLGDGNDQVLIISADHPVIANGGEGNDTFDDMEQTNLPGPFARTFNGGPGDDFFAAGVRSGMPTEYHGDAGTDKVSYSYRSQATTPVGQAISLDDVANDGAPAEGDNVHSDIEYVFGSDQADTISGTANADYLVGNKGADKIDGLGGADALFAGNGTNAAASCDADVLNGGDGADQLYLGGNTKADGGADNDRILSDEVPPLPCPVGSADVANGGAGQDYADFSRLTTPGLSVSLDDVGNDGLGGLDNYHSDIEDLVGSEVGMTLIGSATANHLTGGAGNDVLDGGLGADQLSGGGGIDVADYSSRTEALSLTLDGSDNDGATAGVGEGDGILPDVENLRGGSGADTLAGNGLDNVLDGGPGADTISGGAGVDAVDYSRRTAPVNVTLDSGVGNDGEAGENDTIAADVEGAFGGSGNDKLVGALGNGFLAGLGGDDQLSDAGGVDTLDAGAGNDKVDSVDGAVDHDICGAGADKVTSDAVDTVEADCEPASTPPTDPPTGPPSSPPSGPAPPSTPPASVPHTPVAPIDHTAPTASVTLSAGHLGKLLSGGLKVSVKSSESGSLAAVLTAESTTAGALRRQGVRGVLAIGQANAAGGATRTLTLRLTRKARRALSGSAVAKFKLVVTVTDGVGNKRTLIRHLRIRR